MKKIFFIITLLVSFLFGDVCGDKVFTFKTTDNDISVDSFLKELVITSCNLNVVYKDELAKRKLERARLNKITAQNYTLKQILDLLVANNNLFYTIKNNEIQISYLKTKIFHIDYIPSSRTGTATFQASSNGSGDTNSVDSAYEFNFWGNLSKNLMSILNTSKTKYSVKEPVIDKSAGLVTITATKKQLESVKKYIDKLNDRLHKQILIDVKIYKVNLSKNNRTGINWSQLNFSLAPTSTSVTGGSKFFGSQSIFNNSVFNVAGLLNFLATQGDVNSLSNPKIATLNNQKAIISVGDTINYKYEKTSSSFDSNGNLIPPSYGYGTKFVGILLDITPEISDNGVIILRINPTISAFRDETQLTDPTRGMAPDTTENKLSTVIRIKDGQTLILGGLITKSNSFSENGVPILKEIPLVKYIFASKSKISSRSELVFVVTPHILDLHKKKSFKDLGY